MKKSTSVFISFFLFGTLSIFIINPLNAQTVNGFIFTSALTVFFVMISVGN